MCFANSATSLCGVPIAAYASRPSKSGLHLCLNVKGAMLFWCAKDGITLESLTDSRTVNYLRDRCNLLFDQQFENVVGKRLNKTFRRFAQIAATLNGLVDHWTSVRDAVTYLKDMGWGDGEENGGQGLAGDLRRLSLDLGNDDDEDEVMSGVEPPPSISPRRTQGQVPFNFPTPGDGRRSSRGNTYAPVRAPVMPTIPGPARTAPSSVATASRWTPSRAATPKQRAPSTVSHVTAQTSKGKGQVITGRSISVRDGGIAQIWKTLYDHADGGSSAGGSGERVHFEKCLELQELGMKIVIEAEAQMKETVLLGTVRRG